MKAGNREWRIGNREGKRRVVDDAASSMSLFDVPDTGARP